MVERLTILVECLLCPMLGKVPAQLGLRHEQEQVWILRTGCRFNHVNNGIGLQSQGLKICETLMKLDGDAIPCLTWQRRVPGARNGLLTGLT